MEDIMEQLLVLCNQLVAIGYDQPQVLIAGMLMVVAIAITIVVCAVALVASIPYTIITCIVKFCVWLWRRKHPVEYYEEPPRKKYKEEVDYMPVPKHKDEKQPKQRSHAPSPQSDLTPVYPDWMKQKGGRLL